MNSLMKIDKCEICNKRATYFKIFSRNNSFIFFNMTKIHYFLLCDDHRLYGEDDLIELSKNGI